MLFRSPKPQTPNPKPQTPNPILLGYRQKYRISNLFSFGGSNSISPSVQFSHGFLGQLLHDGLRDLESEILLLGGLRLLGEAEFVWQHDSALLVEGLEIGSGLLQILRVLSVSVDQRDVGGQDADAVEAVLHGDGLLAVGGGQEEGEEETDEDLH